MHPQLELLLQIQDLKTQRRDLLETSPWRELEQQEFHIEAEEAISQLDARIDELKQELPPAMRSRLDKFAKGAGRPVVPIINGICYGCFTSIPTANMSELSRNDRVNHCDHCGRFVYVVAG